MDTSGSWLDASPLNCFDNSATADPKDIFSDFKWCDLSGNWHIGYPTDFSNCFQILGSNGSGSWSDRTPAQVASNINLVTLDGVVNGTAGDDVIDSTYIDAENDMIDADDQILAGEFANDDIVVAGAGDDIVLAGDADDEIYGGTGNDTIIGDNDPNSVALGREDELTLTWIDQESNLTHLGDTQTYDVGGMEVAVTVDVEDGGYVKVNNDETYVEAGEGLASHSGLRLYGVGGPGDTSTTTLNFTSNDIAYGDEIEDVTFRINDIDVGNSHDPHIDIVTVRAFDANGVEVPVTITPENPAQIVNGNTVTAGVLDSGGVSVASQAGSVLYQIAGPVASVIIEYDNGETTDQVVQVTDINFTTTASDATDDGFGDDLILGGGGEDFIDGREGDDVIYGDNAGGSNTSGAERESFNWEGLSDSQIDGGVTVNTGSVTVTYDRTLDTGGHESSLSHEHLNTTGVDGGGEVVDNNSSLTSVTNGQDGQGEFSWDFSEPVENVSFNITDVDTDGVVRVLAFDAGGNQIPVDLTAGSGVTLLDSDGVLGNDTADSTVNTDVSPSSGSNTVNVDIAGPVARIEVLHTQDGSGVSGVLVTDIYYDAPGAVTDDEFAGGDDSILGGAGDDVIYGEEGADTIDAGTGADVVFGDGTTGPSGDDFIDGGEGNDVLTGNAGDDSILGGTGEDTIFGDNGVDTEASVTRESFN